MDSVSVASDYLNNDALKKDIVIENKDMIENPTEAQKKFILEQDEHEKKYREYIRGKINISNQHTNNEDQKIAVLKDTINRLTQELTRYQKKYPPAIDIPLNEIHLISNNDQEDWNSHYKFMQPLFNSYDDKISELINENNLNKSNIAKTTTKNTNLLKENANLQGKINDLLKENSELKNSLSKFKFDNDNYKIEISKLKSDLSKLPQQNKQENPFFLFETSQQQKFNFEQ
eukprot:jgi/Orpsp1_1/1182724/evm.model.c7180000082428.1